MTDGLALSAVLFMLFEWFSCTAQCPNETPAHLYHFNQERANLTQTDQK
jgi:hypothetical protein